MPKLSEFTSSKFIKLFLMGEPGTGKTVCAAGFPGKIKYYDFDNKIASAYSYLKEKNPAQLDQIDYVNCAAIDGKGTAYAKMDKDLEPIVKNYHATGKLEYNTIVIDSSTVMADEMMNWLINYETNVARNSKIKSRKVACQQDYGIFYPMFKEWLGLMLSLPCNFVMTGHITIKQDELTGEIHRMASIPGQMGKKIGIFMPELYLSTLNTKGEYVAKTREKRFPCRTSMQNLPAELKLDYKEFAKYLV